jgi:hypothetical protein
MAFSHFHVDIRKSNNTKYKKSNIKKSNTDEDKKIYIPSFFDFDISHLRKENYLIISDKTGSKQLYVTPLIRVLLNDLKANVNKDESLSRNIKERVNSNARLLIKKHTEQSTIVLIRNTQYILVNTDIEVLEGTLIRIFRKF